MLAKTEDREATPTMIPFNPVSIPQRLKELSLCGFVVNLIPLLSMLPESLEKCAIDCFLEEYHADPTPAPLARILPANVGAASNTGLEIEIRIVDLSVFLERNVGRTATDIARRIREDNNHLRSIQISSYDWILTKRIIPNAAQSFATYADIPIKLVSEYYYKRREVE
jgi:hypothetical protein